MYMYYEPTTKYYKYRSPQKGYRELLSVRGTTPLILNYYPCDNTIIQCKFIYESYNGDIFIGMQGNEQDTFRFFRAANITYLDYGSGDKLNRINGTYITSQTEIYEVEFGNRYVKDIPTNTTKISAAQVTFTRKTAPLQVFGVPPTKDYGTIFYLKILEGTEVKMDLVPCKRMQDEALGLYDKISNVFYTDGTWTTTSDYIMEEGTSNDYDFTQDTILCKSVRNGGKYYAIV